MRTKDTLSHNVVCAQSESVREKLSCEVYLSTGMFPWPSVVPACHLTAHDFEVHRLTHLCHGLSRSLPLSRAHALGRSSRFTNRLSTYAASPRPCHGRGIHSPWPPTGGSFAERLWESSVARPATHASHQLRNVACVTSCSSLSVLAHFSLSPASPPRLRPHLCPSTRLLLDQWEKAG